jgi:hypothetical protein
VEGLVGHRRLDPVQPPAEPIQRGDSFSDGATDSSEKKGVGWGGMGLRTCAGWWLAAW